MGRVCPSRVEGQGACSLPEGSGELWLCFKEPNEQVGV